MTWEKATGRARLRPREKTEKQIATIFIGMTWGTSYSRKYYGGVCIVVVQRKAGGRKSALWPAVWEVGRKKTAPVAKTMHNKVR